MQKMRKWIRKHPRLEILWHYVGNLRYTLRNLMRYGTYMVRPYMVFDDRKVLYIVIQKAACTSIKASMAGLASDKDYVDVIYDIRKTGNPTVRVDPQKMRDYFVFTFVRDPFERLVSCYENKFHTDLAVKPQKGEPLTFAYYLMGYLRKDRGFRAFASRACRIPNRLADNHFASQSFMISRMGRGLKPDYVGHFENLAAEYEPIRRKYGFMPLPHHNPTVKAAKWMDYYDLPTARKVYSKYRKDIEEFGYRHVYDRLISYLQSKDGCT